ncbi:hypothetical protein MmiAt1_08890 [Methanimicrococcus sp. At1]|uniref:Uncharacterized protein n=1 Tax=Methanimicrococcus hacksteinii TaxID=3028293 RepID=A0ABU3VPL7_9EURY|nr:hypothetical protein [Methanimicrococcus sp. At1]MDV0445316.1 hypothetical protein [Methanimicrococcus sp. At1]
MASQSYIEFNNGAKCPVENFKLLNAKNSEQQLIDENGDVVSLHIPETLKVKFEMDLSEKEAEEILSLLNNGHNFTTVHYDHDAELENGVGYGNCHALVVNKDPASKKAYVVCNWPFTEMNILNM